MLAEPASPSLSELRVLLRRRAPGGPGTGIGIGPGIGTYDVGQPGALATGVEAVDRLIGGGLPRGRLTELCGPRSSGRTALALASLAAATRRGEVVALVDVGGGLDVRRAEAAGVLLERLLWVQVPAGEARLGLQATDVVLGAGGFALVVLDLGEVPPRLPDAGFLRLGRAAEKAQAALLLLAPRPAAGTFSSLRLETGGARRPRFLDAQGWAGGAGGVRPGRVLLGLESSLAVPRSRRGGEGGEAPLTFRLR